MSITIRPIQPQDNPSLFNVIETVLLEFGKTGEGYAIADPETRCMFESYNQPGRAYWVVEKDGQVLGGAGFAPVDHCDDPGIAELRKMYFMPELRGLGLADRLITLCLEKARQAGYHSMYLETIPEMQAAQKLYKKHGFAYIDHRIGDSGHHKCHVFMRRTL